MNRKREIPEIFESKTFLDPTYEPGFREVFKDADTIRDFQMNYILFDLRSFTKKPEELNTREDQWLYLLSKAGGDDKLPEFDDDYVARAVERLRIENASDELIHAQEQKMMSQDEIDCRIGDGVARGVEQGIQQGENNALDVARSLGVSEEVLDQIRQKLAENKQ